MPPAKGTDMPALDRKWWTLIAVCTATFMLLLDITVVNVALPDIQRSLHSNFSDLQWVVDAYSLTLAAFLLTAGVIGDMFGRREVFAIGLGVFSASSLVCGLSTSSLMLNLARAAQGVGGAIMFATSLALIAQPSRARSGVRPSASTARSSVARWPSDRWSAGPSPAGSGGGGSSSSTCLSASIAILVTLAKVQESKDPNNRRIDWIGFVSFSVALFMLVFALVRGPDDGWGSPLIVGLLVGAGVLLVVFLVAEWRQRDPMLDLTLFRASGHGAGSRWRRSPSPPRSSPCSCISPSTSRTTWDTDLWPPESASSPSPCWPSSWPRLPAS